jgi:predicted GNAT family N-acyltransferase
MITIKYFLGDANLNDVHFVRREVFINEKGIDAEMELDGTDDDSFHVVAYDNDRPIGTARMRVVDGKLMIGRVAVLKSERSRGIGNLLMRVIMRRAFEAGHNRQYLHAISAVRGFYEKLGFSVLGEEFMEAGICHVNMTHEGDVSGNCDSINQGG